MADESNSDSYPQVADTPIDVHDHPDNNLPHPEPGPRGGVVNSVTPTAKARMERGAVLMSPVLGAAAAVAGMAMPAMSIYNSLKK